MAVFRSQLLTGTTVALGGSAGAIDYELARLGARVQRIDELPAEEDRRGEWARPHGFDSVVFDAAEAFGTGGQAGLRAASERAWTAVREVATGSLIGREQGGKVVLIGPRPGTGRFAGAARSALENLARTLSIEWARHRITTTMIAPGQNSTDAQVAELVCYLLSPGGDYFSGCRFSLGA